MHYRLTLFLIAILPFATVGQVIDEIQFNTPGTDDEWIEICNPTTDVLDLTNFVLLVDNTSIFTFPNAASIAAEACITIGLGDDGDESDSFNAECPFTPTYLRDGLVLNSGTANTNVLPNSTGQITLQNASGTVVDEVIYNTQDISSGDLDEGKTFTLFELAAENSSTGNFNWFASLDPGGSPNLPANANCPSAQTELSFTTTAGSADENVGALNTTVCVRIARPSLDIATTVEVALIGSSVTNGTDIEMLDSPIVLEFPAGSFSTQCLDITVLDDSDTEGIETLNFILQHPAGGRNMATLGANTTFALNIIDDDYTEAVINEILFNPLGSTADNEREYFEVRGTPHTSLAGIWLISIDGDGSATGRINAEIDLSDYTLGSNGLLLVRDVGAPFTPAPAAETTVVAIDFGSSIFQNGTGTFLLVTSHNDNINDIDSDNDGNVDVTSWNTILDAISITDGGVSDFTYAALLGGIDLPRHQGNTTAHGVFRGEANEWFAATSQAGSSGNFEFDFATVWNSADEAIAVNTLTPPQFTPGSIGQTALSIPALSFSATMQAGYPLLQWNRLNSTPLSSLQIYRSADNISFSLLQSLLPTTQRFMDTRPLFGTNYYQLHWLDETGNAQSSKTIQVKNDTKGKINVYPTLVQDRVNIIGMSPNTVVTLYNQIGQVVFQQLVSTPTIAVTVPKKGIYFLQINHEIFKLIKLE